MKKYILFSFALMLGFTLNAQLLTKGLQTFKGESTYLKYTGIARDTLSVLQDTIRIPFLTNKDWPYEWYGTITMDTIAGADTTVTVNLLGKMFEDDTWASITTQTSSAVTTSDIKTIFKSMPSLKDTTDNEVIISKYRYLLLEMIILGNDAVGTGIKLDNVELKLIKPVQ
jgi:hypothetical protein